MRDGQCEQISDGSSDGSLAKEPTGVLLAESEQEKQLVDQGAVHRVVHPLLVIADISPCTDVLLKPAILLQENPEVMSRAAAEAVELLRLQSIDAVLQAGRALALV